MRVGWFTKRSVSREMQAEPVTTEKKRRGATAMEYLVMASFVLVVLIVGVQHVASVTRSLLANSAEATEKTNETVQ